MFGLKIITKKRYDYLIKIEENFSLLNREVDRIKADLDPLRKELCEKMLENNQLREVIRSYAKKKEDKEPSFRKGTKKTTKQ